jgi:hypothetical protein
MNSKMWEDLACYNQDESKEIGARDHETRIWKEDDSMLSPD